MLVPVGGVKESQSVANIAFFCFDISEASQIRRIESLRSLGHEVASYSFRRRNMNEDFRPAWQNIHLGRTENRNFPARLARMATGLVRTLCNPEALARSNVWFARNLDLLVIAAAARLLMGRRDVALVYECLDIHGLMTGKGPASALVRWVERRLLRNVSLLVISSPGFAREYFQPVQGHQGPTALIENKLWLGDAFLPRPKAPRAPGDPLVLGWVGSLRCPDSLSLLAETARNLGDHIRIECHGNVHLHAVPDFFEVVAARSNITYGGPYLYPGDLRWVYAACDVVWAQDLWQTGTNSDWLLPNRIYEAGYFGCPSIGLSGTQTGTCIEERGLGFTVKAPTSEALVALIGSLTSETIRRASLRLLDMPETAFCLAPDELEAALCPVLAKSRPSTRPTSSGTTAVQMHLR